MSADERREVWLLADTDQIIRGVHPLSWCSGWCAVHAPSDHWMRECSLGFDATKKSLYRVCKHGRQHHDPDERTFWTAKLESAKRGSNAAVMAMSKLSDWACPVCPCLCCDITKIIH